MSDKMIMVMSAVYTYSNCLEFYKSLSAAIKSTAQMPRFLLGNTEKKKKPFWEENPFFLKGNSFAATVCA